MRHYYCTVLKYQAVRIVTFSFKYLIRKAWKTEARGKNWPSLQTKVEKRSVEVAKFRLDTGHDLLGKHLHRLNITKDDKCKFCKKKY